MGELHASAGEVDLLPPVGGWMTGYAVCVAPTAGIHDALMARALLLDDGHTRLAMISCDLLGFAPAAVLAMRQRIARRCAIPAGNILIACTHTHSGPASMPLRGVLGHVDNAWLAEAQNKIVDLVAGLPERLTPARFAHGTTNVPGVGFNRQDAAHAVDQELRALAFETSEGKAIATVANYATHAVVLGPDNLEYSGDFPGATARHLQRLRGGTGLYLQGACGDVDPAVNRDRGWGLGTFADCEEIGERLANAAGAALARASWTDEVTLGVTRKTLNIPLDPPPSAEALAQMVAGYEADRLRATEAPTDPIQEQIAVAMLQWAGELQGAMREGTVPRTLPAELFLAELDDLRLVAVPFETYTDIGVGIKRVLAPRPAFLAGYANGLYGYCPSRWAKEQGGYGPDSSARWFSALLTPIGYGADELIVHEGARSNDP